MMDRFNYVCLVPVPGSAYLARFVAKKGCLSMDKRAYFDENV